MIIIDTSKIKFNQTGQAASPPAQPRTPIEYSLPLDPHQIDSTTWSQGGDWAYLIKSVWGNIHEIHFKNTRSQALIDMIFLQKNYTNEISLTFKVNRDYFPQLCEYLVSKGYDRPVGSDAVVCFFSVKIKREDALSRLSSFLVDAALAVPDLLLVNERVMTVIKDDLSKPYVPAKVGSDNYPSNYTGAPYRPTASQLLAIADYGFTEDEKGFIYNRYK